MADNQAERGPKWCHNDPRALCGCKPFGGLCPVVTSPDDARRATGVADIDAAFKTYDRAAAQYRELQRTRPSRPGSGPSDGTS